MKFIKILGIAGALLVILLIANVFVPALPKWPYPQCLPLPPYAANPAGGLPLYYSARRVECVANLAVKNTDVTACGSLETIGEAKACATIYAKLTTPQDR